MQKEPIYLVADGFSGISASVFGLPEGFYWERTLPTNVLEVVTTELNYVEKFPQAKVYGWIAEPSEIFPHVYRYAAEHFNKFEKIYTYEKSLLAISDKFRYVPIGSCFISENDRALYLKSKLLSMVSSLKRMTINHSLRIEILLKLHQQNKADLFGKGFNPLDSKVDGLREYMFSVAVENQISEFYFTEKILDCFLTGTIPLYFGCPSIDRFFDPDGIIKFSSLGELMSIVEWLNPDIYASKARAIETNFHLAKRYATPDNFLYNDLRFNNKTLDRFGKPIF